MRYFAFILMLFMASNVFGATRILKTICPSGCDYTALETAVNANEQNLTDDTPDVGGNYIDFEISGTWSSADTTAVLIHNYTTDATRYINIYTTGAARHSGVYSTSAYRLAPTGVVFSMTLTAVGSSLYIIDGLQVLEANTVNGTIITNSGNLPNATIEIKNCIIKPALSSSGYGFTGGQSMKMNMFNNIIYGFSTAGAGIRTTSTYASLFYNNTLYGNFVGHLQSAGTGLTLKNNIYYNNATDYSVNSATTSNNICKDTTCPDASGDSKTITFTNTTAGSEDFHLASTDTDAIDKGADLSATFTTDIDGTTRTGTWDIGADEYVSAGVTSVISVLGTGVYGNIIFN